MQEKQSVSDFLLDLRPIDPNYRLSKEPFARGHLDEPNAPELINIEPLTHSNQNLETSLIVENLQPSQLQSCEPSSARIDPAPLPSLQESMGN